MNWLARIVLLLCLITSAQSADEDSHIVAAYPIDFPIEEFAELIHRDTPPADNRFFQKSDTLFDLKPKSKTLLKLPKSSLSYLCFNRDTQTIIAKASAEYHYYLASEVAQSDYPINLRLTCKLYQMTAREAHSLIMADDPDQEGQQPILTLSGVGRPGTNVILHGKSGSDDHTLNADLEWEVMCYQSALVSDSKINLTITSSANASKTTLKTQFVTTPIAPVATVLGRTMDGPNCNLVAIFSVAPIHLNGEVMINGRICEDSADHTVLQLYPALNPQASLDPKGILIKPYRVPTDFLPGDYAPVGLDPFAANIPKELDEVDHAKLTPEQTAGLQHLGRTYLDAKPYLSSRGISMTADDWIAYDNQRGLLFARFEDTKQHELLEVLTSGQQAPPQCVRHTYGIHAQPKSDANLGSETLREIYSIVTRLGSPWQLSTTFSNGTKNQSNLSIYTDPTISMNADIVDTQTTFVIPTSPARTSSFSAEKWNFTQYVTHPLTVDTGIDDLDGHHTLLRIDVTVLPVEELLNEFRDRGD